MNPEPESDLDAEFDAEMEAEIWQMYSVDAPVHMAAILAAWAAGDVAGVCSLSHRLAGDSGAVGCVSVEVCGRDLERAAGTSGAPASDLAELVHALERAVANLSADSTCR